jgi:hypothetical protein
MPVLTAAINAMFPSRKIVQLRAVPHLRFEKLDSGLFAAWPPLPYTSFFHREKPEGRVVVGFLNQTRSFLDYSTSLA